MGITIAFLFAWVLKSFGPRLRLIDTVVLVLLLVVFAATVKP